MEKMNKKGQEEIMGFMLVIVLIVVIGLTFVFFLKPQEADQIDLQVENLLHTLTATTYAGQNIGARVENCERGFGCEELGEGLDEVLNAAFSGSGTAIGQNIRGYSLNMSGGVEYYILEGNVTFESRGAATVVSDTLIRLKFYF